MSRTRLFQGVSSIKPTAIAWDALSPTPVIPTKSYAVIPSSQNTVIPAKAGIQELPLAKDSLTVFSLDGHKWLTGSKAAIKSMAIRKNRPSSFRCYWLKRGIPGREIDTSAAVTAPWVVRSITKFALFDCIHRNYWHHAIPVNVYYRYH